jgi:hypothetical protein
MALPGNKDRKQWQRDRELEMTYAQDMAITSVKVANEALVEFAGDLTKAISKCLDMAEMGYTKPPSPAVVAMTIANELAASHLMRWALVDHGDDCFWKQQFREREKISAAEQDAAAELEALPAEFFNKGTMQ